MVLSYVIDDLVRFDEEKAAVRSIADSGHARVMLVCLKAGQVLKDHRSTSQVIAYCLRGTGTFYADGTPRQTAAGTLILLEPHRFHRIEAETDLVLLVTMAPHPAREGYPREQLDRLVPRV